MTTIDTRMHKMASESLVIIMADTLDWQEIQEYASAGNHTAAIEAVSARIELHEHFLNEFEHELAQDPGTYEMHVGNLITYYAFRADQRLTLADKGSPNSNSELDMAEADINKALSFPAAFYADSDVKPKLTEALNFIQKKRRAKSGKCFIATAAYGSALAPEVVTLRSFRETSLRPHAAGRWFIRCYERCSPPLAAAIAERPAARLWVRRLLLRPLIALVGRQS